jgi:hypothetical protein
MNKVTKVSLVPILASCLLAATAIAPAQAAKHHRQAATACAAKPGTMGALFSGTRGPRKTVASSAR